MGSLSHRWRDRVNRFRGGTAALRSSDRLAIFRFASTFVVGPRWSTLAP
jgi:hypothetical protein